MKSIRTRIALASAIATLFLMMFSCQLLAQYDSKVFELKKAGDLYDERGYAQGKSISVDGNLAISESNGNVSYIYPISKFSIHGYPFETSLNYCGSVGFTAFKRYEMAHDAPQDPGNPASSISPYAGWAKFHQNRPAWIIGFNGFAVQVISTSTHFHSDPNSPMKFNTVYNFDDDDMNWVVDGYDFCNRMTDFGARVTSGAMGNTYVDNIRLLRSDGSILELVNANGINSTPPDQRPELYTGHYLPAEANSRAFAVVKYDSVYWPQYMKNHISTISNSNRYPLIPRVVRYYPGDGLEYVFREWIIPYGTGPYAGDEEQGGGRYGGPTIFYLEEVNGTTGNLVQFTRSRHYPTFPNFQVPVTADSTRGRALMLNFANHDISYGVNSLVIQAFGRTTRVRFEKVVPGGNASETNWMPMGGNGYMMDQARDLANLPETSPVLYKSYIGYVTEILDPEGRRTKFTYEPYTRNYVNFGFPHSNSGGNVTVKLKNLRLKEVQEPAARYRISYYKSPYDISYGTNEAQYISDGSDTLTVLQNDPSGSDLHLPKLSNVAAIVNKYDRSNTLLLTDRYDFLYQPNSTFASESEHRVIDRIADDTTRTRNYYRRYTLPNLAPMMPAPRHTVVYKTETFAGDVTTSTDTYFGSSTVGTTLSEWGSNYPISTSMFGSPFVILDTARKTFVNGVTQSYQTYQYALDTVRRYGGNAPLTRLFGRDVIRKVTETRNPATGNPLLKDSVDLLHLLLVDTVGQVEFKLMQKLLMMRKWDSLKTGGWIDPSIPWEIAMYDPRIVLYHIDTGYVSLRLPPQYGLPVSQTLIDSANTILAGVRTTYDTQIDLGDYRSYINRGLKTHDTMVGRGGMQKIPGGEYHYTFRKLERLRNANGADAYLSYDYDFPTLPPLGFGGVRTGTILDNIDSATSYALRGAAYGNFTEEPLGEQKMVRRYNTSGTVDTMLLTSYHERTFYGQISGTVEPNGWYSRFAYDRNGRLKTAWLPYDFQSPDSVYSIDFDGYEFNESYGNSEYRLTHTNKMCDTRPVPADVIDTVRRHGELYADRPVNTVPDCPDCNSTRRKDEGRSMQATCYDPIPYSTQSPTIGYVSFNVVPYSATSIVSLDSAYIQLLVNSIVGECVNLKATIPALGVTKTYSLNCPQNGQGGNGTNRAKGRGRSMQSDDDELPGNYSLKIDLTSVKNDLLGYTPGQGITLVLEVMTPGARVGFVSGFESADARPRLVLKGTFRKVNPLADYTLRYEYNDDSLAATVSAKVDDHRHSSTIIDTNLLLGDSRRTRSTHYAGADGRLLLSSTRIAEGGTERHDTVSFAYTGLGRRTMAKDQVGDSVRTRYDALGRPVETINADNTATTTAYYFGTPASFGITGQQFYGFCKVVVTTDENGVKYAQYYDAFDKLRREVADSGALNLTTTYDYDLQGRLEKVVNAKGDVITYTYDPFGRMKTKSQPDIGLVSYAHDRLGNVRFSQTRKQAESGLVTFNQYDDLNRLTLVGEANLTGGYYDEDNDGITSSSLLANTMKSKRMDDVPSARAQRTDGEEEGGAGVMNKKGLGRSMQSLPDSGRLTATLNPNVLHTGEGSILTSNRTLWLSPVRPVPQFPANFNSRNCPFINSPILGAPIPPVPPYIVHHTKLHGLTPGVPPATESDFENLSLYPEYARMAIGYDTLPPSAGPVWGSFPSAAQWNALAPRGVVRNLKGREAAVAYRDRAAEPYHYNVMSYDERGRVEALLRYTENIGFDAVYYRYNSMNQVIAITSADYHRQHTTWYGYDENGRVDSVWTSLGNVNSGLYSSLLGFRYPGTLSRPGSADILYYYNRMGMMDSLIYPAIQTGIRYAYNRRKWLDSITAERDLPGNPDSPVFKQRLVYDAAGQIRKQRWQHGNGAVEHQDYKYDAANRLTDWDDGTLATNYLYDAAGNRTRAYHNGLYYDTQWSYHSGTNGIMDRVAYDQNGGALSDFYEYNPNGSVRQREHWLFPNGNGEPQTAEQFAYGYRELPHRMQTYGRIPGSWSLNLFAKEDWRYRYNAMGEREQKRLYKTENEGAVPVPEDGKVYPWVYYLLGGSREQLAVYHGQQVKNPFCGDTGMRVYLYPVEYLTHGVAYTGVKEDISQIITLPNGRKQYRIHDHLASLRATIDSNVTAGYNYDPWGGELDAPSPGSRRGFNDREEDAESGDKNLGVRQYGSEDGQFYAVDPLWQKFPQQSPYVYSYNNPLRFTDPGGRQAIITGIPFVDIFTHRIIYLDLRLNVAKAESRTNAMARGEIVTLCVPGYDIISYGGVGKASNPSKADETLGGIARDQDSEAGVTNNVLDALRHAYAMALTAQDHDMEHVITLGDMYEDAFSDEPEAGDMDRHNNRIGARIGMMNPDASPNELFKLVYEAMKRGELVLRPQKRLDMNYDNIKNIKPDAQ